MADEISFLLRRAEQESIEAIRALHPTAAERHAEMASHYSRRARTLLGEPTAAARAS
ncbi:MAG: hypothetical protein ABIW16_01215 [Sphingomicrobium sp.]